ncbi:MAG TPA: hypothetical protein VKT49_00840 [Bryobacteraceae bacterium]|nr:hypothetical protein [Bryobacteraceae bacterium]
MPSKIEMYEVRMVYLAITVDDPKTYARPFTIRLTQFLLPDTDLIEYFCSDNEKDLRHFR